MPVLKVYGPVWNMKDSDRILRNNKPIVQVETGSNADN